MHTYLHTCTDGWAVLPIRDGRHTCRSGPSERLREGRPKKGEGPRTAPTGLHSNRASAWGTNTCTVYSQALLVETVKRERGWQDTTYILVHTRRYVHSTQYAYVKKTRRQRVLQILHTCTYLPLPIWGRLQPASAIAAPAGTSPSSHTASHIQTSPGVHSRPSGSAFWTLGTWGLSASPIWTPERCFVVRNDEGSTFFVFFCSSAALPKQPNFCPLPACEPRKPRLLSDGGITSQESRERRSADCFDHARGRQ